MNPNKQAEKQMAAQTAEKTRKKLPFADLFKGKAEVDMTEGNIFRHIIAFALPLMVGNLFQQLYNTVDTWVVGNYVGDAAYSAVGTVGPVVNMLIGFFTGLTNGAGVVISQYFGAGQTDKVRKTVHTSVVMTLILGVIFTVLGIFMTPFMVGWMGAVDEVAAEQNVYLTIYFAGIMGLMIYNMGSAILRAVGNSTLPFFFLVVSALINIVLDLVFVLSFGMGVDGVAYATIIAQGISAVLVIVVLFKSKSMISLRISEMKMHTDQLLRIIRVGFPAAIQMAITAFSNVFVQNYINHFGKFAMGGWTTYSKVDQLIFLPMQSVALAVTTFVGQNLGKGLGGRSKKGVRISLLVSGIFTVVLCLPVIVFAPQIVQFFIKDSPETVVYGTILLRYLSPFYVLCCINQIYAGALRGAGNSTAPMIIMVSSFVVFRQIYLYVLTNFITNTFIPVALSYPAGWLVCSALTLLYYRKVRLEDHTVL